MSWTLASSPSGPLSRRPRSTSSATRRGPCTRDWPSGWATVRPASCGAWYLAPPRTCRRPRSAPAAEARSPSTSATSAARDRSSVSSRSTWSSRGLHGTSTSEAGRSCASITAVRRSRSNGIGSSASSSWVASTSDGTRAGLLHRDGGDLHHQLGKRQGGDTDQVLRRRRIRDVLLGDLAVDRVLAHVRHVHRELHDVPKRGARLGQQRLDVLEHLARLRCDVILADELALGTVTIERDLAREDDELLRLRDDDAVRERHRAGLFREEPLVHGRPPLAH